MRGSGWRFLCVKYLAQNGLTWQGGVRTAWPLAIPLSYSASLKETGDQGASEAGSRVDGFRIKGAARRLTISGTKEW